MQSSSLPLSQDPRVSVRHEALRSHVAFHGVIDDGDPVAWMEPILETVHQEALAHRGHVVEVNFKELRFLNSSGIKAILNFAPARLKVPRDVRLKNVDLSIELETLSFYLAKGVR